MSNTIIQAKNLNLYYGENHALKNICLDLPEREITALIGLRAAASRPFCAPSTA